MTTARLVAEAARFRRESRGTHFRTDHPERDDAAWRVHTRIVPEGALARVTVGSLRAVETPVAPPAA